MLGPSVILTYPDNLISDLDDIYLNQIKSMINSDERGFFTHFFSQELKTANLIFSLESNWARGRSETIMISVIVSEEEPDYSYYEDHLSKFVEKVKQIPQIFKALYINSGAEKEKDEILDKFRILKKEFNNLNKIFSLKSIETESQLISFKDLKKRKTLQISKNIVKKIGNLLEKKKNCFIVYRTQNNALKIDLIPVDKDEIVRLVIIFGDQMTIKILQEVSKVLLQYDDTVSLIFTTGICQEIDRCIYEVYLDINSDVLNEIIKEIYKISGIIEIGVDLIKL
jgi:sugar-specific transcriptional regulator TrmB